MSGKKPDNPFPRTSPPSCHELIDHSSLFTPAQVYPVGPDGKEKTVFVYVGYNLANITFVKTPLGWVVVDTGQDMAQMETVWNLFEKRNETKENHKKVFAVVYTHHHSDHVNGTQYLVNNNLFVDNKVKIYGADNLDAEFQQENGLIAPLMSCRAMAQYNNLLQITARVHPEDTAGMNSGIGPIINSSDMGYVVPTDLFSTATPYVSNDIHIGGRLFSWVYVPSEANSEVALYLKDDKILLSAEVIQDHTFPNLYTLRGSNFRDPSNWYKSIDCFLTNYPEAQQMVLQHGPPILRSDAYDPNDITTQPITMVLTKYRDAIQYVRDQTLRWALKGYAKEEIMHLVDLPPLQKSFSPWLRQFYGTVKHSVPAVYNGYIGWFDGDPIALNPIPRSIISKKLLDLMGGRQAVLAKAKEVYDEGNALGADYDNKVGNNQQNVPPEVKKLIVKAHEDWQFAAELATLIIRERPHDQGQEPLNENENAPPPKYLLHPDPNDGDDVWWQARYLKGACFRQMGFRNICANWRGTYLTAGYELEGVPLLYGVTEVMKKSEVNMAKYASVPYTISELQVRLSPEKTLEDSPPIFIEEKKIDSSTAVYRLQIRNKVLIATDFTGQVGANDVKISGDTETLNLLLYGDTKGGYDEVLNGGKLTITPSGTGLTAATKFFAHFDGGRFSSPPNIYIH